MEFWFSSMTGSLIGVAKRICFLVASGEDSSAHFGCILAAREVIGLKKEGLLLREEIGFEGSDGGS